MRLKSFPVALALSVAVGALGSLASPPAWAKGAKAKGEKDGDVPDAINRQFKWEEGVVGTNDKKLDRKKIAAMQEAARKEDEKHKNDPPKKTQRAAGIDAPASSTLPTMDIEKAAATPAKTPKAHPVATQPKTRDSLDQLLDSESKDTGGGRRGGDGGLGKVLAIGGSSSSGSSESQDSPAPKAKASKHAARRSH